MKNFIKYLLTPHYGSNRISRLVRRKIEHRPLIELIGIPLMSLTFFTAVIVPQTEAGFASTELYFDTQTTHVEAVVTPSRFRWPLATFGVSQYFTYGHPGLDLTDPAGTPIYPVMEGKVILAASLFNGYGRHVIVEHDNQMTSVYAHLTKIDVKEGEEVTKSTELGTVGATGWATGNHLHLEILQNGVPVNPMEVLPEIKKYESKPISQLVESDPIPNLSL